MNEPLTIPQFSEEKSVYFNALGVGVSAGDVHITLVRNGVPVLGLNTSYPVALSLARALTELLAGVEHATQQKLLDIEELSKLVHGGGNEPKS